MNAPCRATDGGGVVTEPARLRKTTHRSPPPCPRRLGCDASGHTYRLVTNAQRTAPLNLRLDDPTPADDTAVLTAALSRVRPVVDTETVAVDTTQPSMTSARTYLAGQRLRH